MYMITLTKNIIFLQKWLYMWYSMAKKEIYDE